MKKEKKSDFKSTAEKKQYVKIPIDVLHQSDSLLLDLEQPSSENEIIMDRNSRCVFVPTKTSCLTPHGRKEKKVFKGKVDFVKFRCSIYEKKLLKIKATKCRLSVSEFIRRSLFEKEIIERFTQEHIELYKMLLKYHNNFKSIGNMYRKRNPNLAKEVYDLANEIKIHLKKFQQ